MIRLIVAFSEVVSPRSTLRSSIRDRSLRSFRPPDASASLQQSNPTSSAIAVRYSGRALNATPRRNRSCGRCQLEGIVGLQSPFF